MIIYIDSSCGVMLQRWWKLLVKSRSFGDYQRTLQNCLYKYNSNTKYMRNNFAHTLPFPKKDTPPSQTSTNHHVKTHQQTLDQAQRKSCFQTDHSTLKTEVISSLNIYDTLVQQDSHQKQVSGYSSIQNSCRIARFNPFLGKEKKVPKVQRSPPKPSMCFQSNSPKKAKMLKGEAVRTTLKNMLHTRGMTSLERSFQNSPSRVQSSSMNLSNSKGADGHVGQAGTNGKSLTILQQQNQILREENMMLKCELAEIKNHLMSVSPSKKGETNSSLRDTIKKEDGEIKELRVKLQINNKKVATLNALLANKDEEIEFLNSKVVQLEGEILELKERNVEKIEQLKSKIGGVVRGYAQLQQKFSCEEREWVAFTQKWMEEKSTYIHRISFLQSYISSNQ